MCKQNKPNKIRPVVLRTLFIHQSYTNYINNGNVKVVSIVYACDIIDYLNKGGVKKGYAVKGLINFDLNQN